MFTIAHKSIVFALVCMALANGNEAARAQTTVTLTTTFHDKASPSEKQLTANLLALLEVEASQHDALQVVERQQLDLALHEQVISTANNDERILQLGKLSKAELILTAKLLNAAQGQTKRLFIRVTESRTAVARGITVVPVSFVELEEAAAEIIAFLTLHASDQNADTPTIAVLPFDSVDRFDRLRPLERGLRDLFVSALMKHNTCRVVQRQSMQQLLAELELERAGLTFGSQGLKNAPDREATYVVRGKIDEQIQTSDNQILIKVHLIDAQSKQVLAKIDRACQQSAVATAVADIVADILRQSADGKRQPKQASDDGKKEVDRLFEMAARDVFRFIRKCPDDDGHYPLNIPGLGWQGWRGNITADSDLGKHLLKKSIDRLESVLFIYPDRPRAAMLLAYCLSFHVEGVWRPKQCESLLRRLLADSQNEKMQKLAFRLLADMYFRHQGGLHGWNEISQVDPDLLKQASEHRLDVFANAPKQLRDSRWVSLLRVFRAVCDDPQHGQPTVQRLQQTILTKIEKAADQTMNKDLPQNTRDYLSNEIASIASAIARNRKNSDALKQAAKQMLLRWTSQQDPRRRIVGAQKLYYLRALSPQACSDIIRSAISDEKSVPPAKGWTADIVWLAEVLLKHDEAESALSLLETYKLNPNARKDYHAPHEYGFQLGQCYEQLGRKQDALNAYLKYIELPSHYGSSKKFETRIRELGGVPLDDHRDVDVRYPELAPGEVFHCRILATDGDHLYCVNGFKRKRNGDSIPKVRVLELASGTWNTIDGPDDRITDLAATDGYLWVGTRSKGLWRFSHSAGTWEHWTTDNGLPLNSVLNIVVHGQTAFASIGNVNSHGHILSGAVVRITIEPRTSQANIDIYRDKHAPEIAPASMVIAKDRLVACGQRGKVHALNLKSNQWKTIPQIKTYLVATGPSGIWTVPRGCIASLLGTEDTEEKNFSAKGRLKNYPAGTYLPRFLVEHDGDLWIGGEPWRKFTDTGLFRLNLATGKLKRYGAREGFRYAEHNSYECYESVWAGDRLWVATSFGLAEISMRAPSQQEEQTLIETYVRQIQTLLPKKWSATSSGNIVSIRRQEQVLWAPLYGRPPYEGEESGEEYLRRIGAMVPLEIDLRFVQRLSAENYNRQADRYANLLKQAERGFKSKTTLSRFHERQEQYKLPLYYDQHHSIYVNGVPPKYTMVNDAAHEEMNQIFTNLKTVLRLYEGADPLSN